MTSGLLRTQYDLIEVKTWLWQFIIQYIAINQILKKINVAFSVVTKFKSV